MRAASGLGDMLSHEAAKMDIAHGDSAILTHSLPDLHGCPARPERFGDFVPVSEEDDVMPFRRSRNAILLTKPVIERAHFRLPPRKR